MPPAPKVACRKCGTMIAKTGLRKHEKTCGEEKGPRVPCPDCELTFQDNQGFKSHFKKKHSNERKPCFECDEVFDSKDKLRNHVNQHHTDKFRCECGKNHASTQNLNKHILQMTKEGNTGHEPKIKKIVIDLDSEPEASKKRKAVEMNPVEKFFDTISDNINRPRPTHPLCLSKKLCTTTRLSHGFPGRHQEYCSNHSNEVPGLVDLCPLCKYVGCATRAHTSIVTTEGNLNFCADHIKQLIREGLPDPEVNVKYPKDCHKKCIEEGCQKRASYDGGLYCKPHSREGICDDKRVCEELGCEKKRPAFGYPGETPTWCGDHKKDGMCSHVQCVEPDCEVSASFGLEGTRPSSCAAHKKDGYILLSTTMCAMACCNTTFGKKQGKFFHPEHRDKTSEFYQKRICCFGRRVLIEDALMNNDIARLDALIVHFRMDRVLTLNAQSAFRFECENRYYKFLKHCVSIVFDDQAEKGPKVIGALRPDIFYKWCIDGINYGIHIEYDETPAHEADSVRLKRIAENAECFDRVYVIRVRGGHGTKNPVCERISMENFAYFRVTKEGRSVASNVADAVVQRIGWIEQGLGPSDSRSSMLSI